MASLVPAATEMLLAMGARENLVAVSNYETAPQVKDLPRVGDYQTTDWEKLARLKPDAMIIQAHPDRVPPGLREKAKELGIQLVNVQIERLEDVFNTMQQLAAVAGQEQAGKRTVQALRDRIHELKEQCAQKPKVSVLISRDADGKLVIGPDTFLDDLLAVVNATNAAASLEKRYPSIDREKIIALKPEVVIVLLPDAPKAMIERAERFWADLPDVPAVKNKRVNIITESYSQVPGPRIVDVAELFAEKIQGVKRTVTTAPTTRAGSP